MPNPSSRTDSQSGLVNPASFLRERSHATASTIAPTSAAPPDHLVARAAPNARPPRSEDGRGRPVRGKVEQQGLVGEVFGGWRRGRSPFDPPPVEHQEEEPGHDERRDEDVEHRDPRLHEVEVLGGEQESGHAGPQDASEDRVGEEGEQCDREGAGHGGGESPSEGAVAERRLPAGDDPAAERGVDGVGLFPGVLQLARLVVEARVEASVLGVIDLVEHVLMGGREVVEAQPASDGRDGADHQDRMGVPPLAGLVPLDPRRQANREVVLIFERSIRSRRLRRQCRHISQDSGARSGRSRNGHP